MKESVKLSGKRNMNTLTLLKHIDLHNVDCSKFLN